MRILLAAAVAIGAVAASWQWAAASTTPPALTVDPGGVVCSAAAGKATTGCAPLFQAGAPLGLDPQVRTVRVGIDGGAAATVRLVLSGFEVASPAPGMCTAARPSDAVLVRVSTDGAAPVFDGSLTDLTRLAGGLDLRPGSSWPTGSSAAVRIEVRRNPAAGNEYMGCSMSGSLDWAAYQ